MAKFNDGSVVKHNTYGVGTVVKVSEPGGSDPNMAYHVNFSGSVRYMLEKELKEFDPLKAGFHNYS